MSKTAELTNIIADKSAEIASQCGPDICKWGYKPNVLKAFRCSVNGSDGDIIHAQTASKARYQYKLNVGDIYPSAKFSDICVRRAPAHDMKFPQPTPSVAALDADDKNAILHAFGGGSHIHPERWGYRDHYCAGRKDARMLKLVALGLFRGPCGVDAKCETPVWCGAFFYLTDAGKQAALALIGLRECAA